MSRLARWRSRATAIVSATVRVGIEQGVLERPAEAALGPLVRRPVGDVVAPQDDAAGLDRR